MKNIIINIIITIIVLLSSSDGYAQSPLKGYKFYVSIIDGDTVQCITMPDVKVFSKKLGRKNRRDMKRYARLVRAVKLTYPIAIEAGRKLKEMETHLATIESKREQDKYVKSVEDSLKKAYMPILKEMSMYQGMVLLKLIDRQTGKTSFKLVQELRGKFSAFFWQNITRLFGGNLKVEYDKEGEDAMIEEIVVLYEIHAI